MNPETGTITALSDEDSERLRIAQSERLVEGLRRQMLEQENKLVIPAADEARVRKMNRHQRRAWAKAEAKRLFADQRDRLDHLR